MDTSTRLPGHGLFAEGKPYRRVTGDPSGDYNAIESGYVGRGLCSCGADSPETDSDADRKRWHRKHKEEVRETIAAEQEADRA
jgi:hypothetical protein